jgi:hypothetical protein
MTEDLAEAPPDKPVVRFEYQNHRGLREWRVVVFERLEWVPNPDFGYQPGWFLTGYCRNRKARRSFALSHIIHEYGGLNFVWHDRPPQETTDGDDEIPF